MELARFLHGAPSDRTEGLTLGHGGGYDLFGALFFGGRRGRAFSRLAELSGARPGDRVLDVGCGTGQLTRRMAALVGPEGEALGVDPSPGMLGRARTATSAANCRYAEGVAEELDAESDSFDVVTSSLMIHHLPDGLRPRALAEMLRVLRPGGRLLLADFRPPSNHLARHLIGALTGPAMEQNPIHLLRPLTEEAGFTNATEGDVHPWLHYVQARKRA